jgi:hypothetical protein
MGGVKQSHEGAVFILVDDYYFVTKKKRRARDFSFWVGNEIDLVITTYSNGSA